MRQEYISSKIINFPYIINKRIKLQFPKLDYDIKGLVFHADNEEIMISLPKNDVFKKGTKCSAELIYMDNILKLETEIKFFEEGILYIEVPRKAMIIQKRGFLRVKCDIPCNVERFSSGKIKDISAGGAYIIIENPENMRLLTKDNFKLQFTIKNRKFNINCKLIELNGNILRLQFKTLSQEEEDFIANYCQVKDLEATRRRI